jgi:gliding motility-associated-like protein
LITVSVGEFTATSATNFTVTIITLLITQQPIDLTVCEGQLATFTTQATGANNIAYRWQYSQNGNAPFADISNGNGYSNATTATLSINTTGNFGAGRYRCVISGEFAQPVTTEDKGLVVTPPSAAPTAANVSRCGNGTINLTASGGANGQYKWYTATTGQTAIAGEVNSSYTTPSLSATTTYYVTLTSNGCESVRVPVVATVTVAAAPTTTGASGCLGSALVLTASGGTNGQYRWYTAAAGGAALQGETNSTFTLSSISATTTFYVSLTTANCESTRTPVTATLLTAGCSPVIATQPLVTQVEGIVTLNLLPLITTLGTLDVASLKIITQPRSGATASITNGVLTINYSNQKSFSGSDEVVIEACNTNGLCSQQSFSIEVAGEVVVYNAVSPNGDDKNEYFKLQYIEAVSPKNRVTIFNRWGDEVFFVDDYDNANRVFSGRTSDGAFLPPGTYFYKIALHDTGKLITGFLALRY